MVVRRGVYSSGMLRLSRLLVVALFGLAIIYGSVFAAYNLFGFLSISFMFGLSVGVLAIPPNIISLGYLFLVIRLVVRSSTRACMYKPQDWVPDLLGLPLVAYSSYFLIETYRGF